MNSNLCRIFVVAGAGALLAACGTTSSFSSAPEASDRIDLTGYSRLLITDFVDEASDKAAPAVQPIVKFKVEAARVSFANEIASAVSDAGGFSVVTRAVTTEAIEGGTLVMRGAITRWEDGDVALRMIIGLGAGSARFDARIQLLDGGSGNVLGTWLVDKNSWVLGGMIAAAQTPETFLPGAARSIGAELGRRKREGSLPPPKRQ